MNFHCPRLPGSVFLSVSLFLLLTTIWKLCLNAGQRAPLHKTFSDYSLVCVISPFLGASSTLHFSISVFNYIHCLVWFINYFSWEYHTSSSKHTEIYLHSISSYEKHPLPHSKVIVSIPMGKVGQSPATQKRTYDPDLANQWNHPLPNEWFWNLKYCKLRSFLEPLSKRDTDPHM